MNGSQMLTAAPAAKVTAATLAAALTSVALYAIKYFLIKGGADLPEPVQYAIGVLITAGVTFAAGYLVPPAARDVVVTPLPPLPVPPADPPPAVPPAGIP